MRDGANILNQNARRTARLAKMIRVATRCSIRPSILTLPPSIAIIEENLETSYLYRQMCQLY